MPTILSDIETRVLGSLVEKQVTTPEYYPLTLNALTAACNQKNNRNPVTSYSEDQVAQAIEHCIHIKTEVYEAGYLVYADALYLFDHRQALLGRADQ